MDTRHGELSPPRLETEAGRPRRVGVEVELLSLEIGSICRCVERLFGGRIVSENQYVQHVRGTSLGDFRIEVDSHPLKTLAQARSATPGGLGAYARVKESVLRNVAAYVTPKEVVAPPLAFERLPELDRLVIELGRAGGEGTGESLAHVVGVHFNTTLPSTRAPVLLDYLRAYTLLHRHIRREGRLDPTRRLLRFASAYPRTYEALILDPSYAPDLARLVDDYLRHNPTRNRALDMLPAFAELAPDRVRQAVDDPLVRPRPTFHFRLPNSEVGNPRWRLTDEWQRWLEVERLASEPRRIGELAQRRRATLLLRLTSWLGEPLPRRGIR